MGLKCYMWLGHPTTFIHSSSSSYRYNVCQHLLLWLGFIMMQPQPDICFVSQYSAETVVVGDSLYFSLGVSCLLWLEHLNSQQLFFIHIKCVSASPTVAGGHRDAPNLIYLGLKVKRGSRRFSWFFTWIILQFMTEASHPQHTHSKFSSYIY
jgi:hypothetical protein